jgi:hypothetical protein
MASQMTFDDIMSNIESNIIQTKNMYKFEVFSPRILVVKKELSIFYCPDNNLQRAKRKHAVPCGDNSLCHL